MSITYLKTKPFALTLNEGGKHIVLSILPNLGLPFYFAVRIRTQWFRIIKKRGEKIQFIKKCVPMSQG